MKLSNAPTANPNQPKKSPMQEMYENQAKVQKETLKQAYDNNLNQMNQQKRDNQLRTDANLNRTDVESRRDARNNNEIQNAYGLSSGAMAQARLANQNQRQKNMTLLRLQQNQADAKTDANINLLQQAYLGDQAKIDAGTAAGIAKDQAQQQRWQEEKDWQKDWAKEQFAAQQQAQIDREKRAQEYAAAQKAEQDKAKAALAAAQLMAGTGDYSRLGALYGLTPEEIAKLMAAASPAEAPAPSYGSGPRRKKGDGTLDFGDSGNNEGTGGDKNGGKFDTGLNPKGFMGGAYNVSGKKEKPAGPIATAGNLAAAYARKRR